MKVLLFITLFFSFNFDIKASNTPSLPQILKEMNNTTYNNLVTQLAVESWIAGNEANRLFFIALKDRMDLKEDLIQKLQNSVTSYKPHKMEHCHLGTIRCDIGKKMLELLDYVQLPLF